MGMLLRTIHKLRDFNRQLVLNFNCYRLLEPVFVGVVHCRVLNRELQIHESLPWFNTCCIDSRAVEVAHKHSIVVA